MSDPIGDVCNQLATVVKAIEGIRDATGLPPEQISVFPFVNVYVQHADWTPVPMGSVTGMLTVNLDLQLARKGQPCDVAMMNRLHYAIVVALYKALRDGTVPGLQTINQIPVTLSVWGRPEDGNQTVGYQFEANVKVQGVIQ